MLIGSMNHPGRSVLTEIKWITELGLDFIDLTLEPPLANARQIDVDAIRSALEASHLGIIGHTAYYLPIGSAFESIRRAAIDEFTVSLETFATLGAKWMNIHPDFSVPFHDRSFIVNRNLESIRELLKRARDLQVGIMLENLPGNFNSVRQISELLEPLPEVGMHLDIGHTNLMVERNTADELLAAFGTRLRHVHLHDNRGGAADLHLPLGAGTIDVARHIRSLQAIGYDGTITLEVFTPDHHYLAYSRDVLRRIWDESASRRVPVGTPTV